MYSSVARILIIFILVISVLIPGYAAPHNALKSIQQDGEIKIGVINGPLHYRLTNAGPVGFDYALALGFADYLGVKLIVKHYYSDHDLALALAQNKIDVAAPRVTLPQSYSFLTSPIIERSSWVYVYGETFSGRCDMIEDSKRVTVNYLLPSVEKLTGVNWQANSEETLLSVITGIATSQSDCTMFPKTWLRRMQSFDSKLSSSPVGDSQFEKRWWVNAEQSNLQSSLFEYIHLSRVNQSLAILLDSQPEPQVDLPELDSRRFLAQVEEQFVTLQREFLSIGDDIGWPLVAAVDYLESQWHQPDIASQTEAQSLSERLAFINQRLDAIANQLPARVKGPDRIWMMLAAYQLGIEHLEQARQLTLAAGANPDLWIDIKQQLPALANPAVYTHTQIGYAPGKQAVTFVEQVRYIAETLTLFMNNKTLKM